MSVAKIATGMNKPRGITIVGPDPQEVMKFLEPLPVHALNGVGPKTAERLAAFGITTLGQIQRASIADLWPIMGRSSRWLYDRARGIDERPVIDNGPRIRKSISKDRTFMEDIQPDDVGYLYEALSKICKGIGEKLIEKRLRFRTVTVKIRYDDYTTVQRSKSIPVETDDHRTLEKIAKTIFDKSRNMDKAIRLLGVKVSGLRETSTQACLVEFLKQITIDDI